MSPRAQQEAILRHMGWELREKLFHNGEWKHVPTWVESKYYEGKPEDYCMAGQILGTKGPDFLNDLNAMHEAEQLLRGKGLIIDYKWMLEDACAARKDAAFCCAPASVRAEVYLKLCGLWEDSK